MCGAKFGQVSMRRTSTQADGLWLTVRHLASMTVRGAVTAVSTNILHMIGVDRGNFRARCGGIPRRCRTHGEICGRRARRGVIRSGCESTLVSVDPIDEAGWSRWTAPRPSCSARPPTWAPPRPRSTASPRAPRCASCGRRGGTSWPRASPTPATRPATRPRRWATSRRCAAQHSMTWVNLALKSGWNTARGTENDLNRLGFHQGAAAQSLLGSRPDDVNAADLATAEHLGRRVAEHALIFAAGRAALPLSYRHERSRCAAPGSGRPSWASPCSRRRWRRWTTRCSTWPRRRWPTRWPGSTPAPASWPGRSAPTPSCTRRRCSPARGRPVRAAMGAVHRSRRVHGHVHAGGVFGDTAGTCALSRRHGRRCGPDHTGHAVDRLAGLGAGAAAEGGGDWASAAAVGIAIGPVVGGLLLSRLWWGSVFLLNLPVSLICLVGIGLWVPRLHVEQRRPLDGRVSCCPSAACWAWSTA